MLNTILFILCICLLLDIINIFYTVYAIHEIDKDIEMLGDVIDDN